MAGKLVQQLTAYVAKEAPPKFRTFAYYAKVELVPPSPKDIVAIKNGIQDLLVAFGTRRWRKLTVKQAWLNTLVGVECATWFFIGECIGKGKIIGYKV